MDPFGDSSDLKSDIIPQNKKNGGLSKKIILIIILIFFIILILTGIIIIVYISMNNQNENNKNEINDNEKDNEKDNDNDDDNDKNEQNISNFSKIICLYKIDDCSNSIPLLGEEYKNNEESIINILINGTKIGYKKKYEFPENGTYLIKYILNKTINMDYIFKNKYN